MSAHSRGSSHFLLPAALGLGSIAMVCSLAVNEDHESFEDVEEVFVRVYVFARHAVAT